MGLFSSRKKKPVRQARGAGIFKRIFNSRAAHQVDWQQIEIDARTKLEEAKKRTKNGATAEEVEKAYRPVWDAIEKISNHNGSPTNGKLKKHNKDQTENSPPISKK